MEVMGTNIIKANGINVSYSDNGEGTYPIIFIHGFPFNKSAWKPQIDMLKKTNRVITYDIRGFGDSETNNENTSITLFAHDLLKFMDALEIKKAILCGLSMGGYILLEAVSLYPHRFKGLILCDTQCIADTPEAKEKRLKTIKQIEKNGSEEFAKGFLESAFCKESYTSKKRLIEKLYKEIIALPPTIITNTLLALAQRTEKCTILKDIMLPVLIICGKEDKITPIDRSEFLFSNIEHSSLKIISDAGHLSNLEQPEEFNKCVNTFITAVLK
ncbi:MAG: alpha/beta hydrolase [Bacteroidetes bacterium]|nr:alpha/beta hydrolase [Bacteroidota bacterium]